MTGKFVSQCPLPHYLRKALLMLCALSLLLPVPISAQQPRASAKKPLTHGDYDSWRSIQGRQISPDGKFIAYAIGPQDGDGEIVVSHPATGKEWRYGRGWRPPMPMPEISDPAVAATYLNQINRLTRPSFTADSRFVVFIIEPNKAEILKARKEKKKSAEMPKNALGIMDLSTGFVTLIDRVKSFQLPEQGSGSIAYLLEKDPAEKKDEKRPASGPAPVNVTENLTSPTKKTREKKKEYGSDLVWLNLADHSERTFADVIEYSLTRDAKSLVYTVSALKEETNGVYAVTSGGNNVPTPLVTGRGKYQRLAWNDDQTQLAFIGSRDEVGAEQSTFNLYLWDRKAPRAEAIVSAATPGLPAGFAINEKAPLNFSSDGRRLFLGTSSRLRLEKEPDPDLPVSEKVAVDLWHWKDDYIQPMQKMFVEQERNRSYRAVFHLKEKKFVQLADETMQEITPSADGLWAIGTDDRSYRTSVGWESFGGLADIYLVNTVDGSRKQLLKKCMFGVTLSPGGKYALFYDGKDWNTFSIPEGKVTNLTKNLNVKFWQEDHDFPQTPPSYGQAGWVMNDKYVLLYDQYDIWRIAPDGSSVKNLTDGLGRKEKTVFRYVRFDSQERAIDPAQPMLLRAENQWRFDSGFYRESIDGGPPEKLIMAAKNFSSPIKAKSADVLLLTASRFDEFPDLLMTDPSFKELKKVSQVGAQKDRFYWGKAELIRYKSLDGVQLSGILIKPDNFDPKKRYPMIVYIYEKLSQNLHQFVTPSPGTSINPAYYASNGYLVFMPDIVYTIGYPGQSALKCVLPAVQAVVDQGFVDENAIGIQGHSWGGYQAGYLVTQTNRFRAAVPGAMVGNMISAYGSIRWGTGLPRQFQYEHAQSRIGGNLWEYPMRFIDNSPIFHAHRIQTPILLLHNDNDDVVPWYQGIEFYLALRRLDKEVYLLNYNGEYHTLRKRENQKDYTRRMQEFFDHFLKAAPKPEWMEKGVPYLFRDREERKYQAATDKDDGGEPCPY